MKPLKAVGNKGNIAMTKYYKVQIRLKGDADFRDFVNHLPASSETVALLKARNCFLQSGASESELEKYDFLVIEKVQDSKLKQLREKHGFSQGQLADKSGVKMRMIQYYEQGSNDINKAQGITLYRLSSALGCKIEDLMELDRLSSEEKSQSMTHG